MRKDVCKTTELGELVAVAFDEAALYSSNPREVSRLASGAVMRMLRHARKASLLLPHRRQTLRRTTVPDGVGS